VDGSKGFPVFVVELIDIGGRSNDLSAHPSRANRHFSAVSFELFHKELNGVESLLHLSSTDVVQALFLNSLSVLALACDCAY
jgi:hypothetical protein